MADVQDAVGLRREPCPHLQQGKEDTSVLPQETLPLPDSRALMEPLINPQSPLCHADAVAGHAPGELCVPQSPRAPS